MIERDIWTLVRARSRRCERESWIMTSHRLFVGVHEDPKQLRRKPGFSKCLWVTKPQKKEQNLKQVCCGASKEKFLTAFHERPSMPRCLIYYDLCLLAFRKAFLFSFIKTFLAFITLTCANTWDAFNVLRQPPFNTVPKHVLKNRATSPGPYYTFYKFPA